MRKILFVLFMLMALPFLLASASEYSVFHDGDLLGIMDATGNIVLPAEYEALIPAADCAAARLPDEKSWRVIGYDGTVRVDTDRDYELIMVSDDGTLFTVMNGEGLYGAVDTSGNVVVEIKYLSMSAYTKGYTVADEDSFFGHTLVLDASGEVVCEGEADSVMLWGDCALLNGDDEHDGRLVRLSDGKELPVMSFNRYTEVTDKYAIVYAACPLPEGQEEFSGSKYVYQFGVLRNDGKTLVPTEYDSITLWGDNAFLYTDRLRCVRLDTQPIREISIPSSDYVVKCVDDYAVVQSGWKYGVIYRDGTTLLEFVYDEVILSPDLTVKAVSAAGTELFRLTPTGAEPVSEAVQSFETDDYRPFTGQRLTYTDTEPSLRLTGALPRIDCATALYPVASAVVTALYPEASGSNMLSCSKTSQAYTNLINGDVDCILCAQPSEAQLAAAAEAGVSLKLTPFGREAFVFIVSVDTPVDSLTVEQIRSVYSGEVRTWDELGIDGLGDIVAYQRPENSGSQTALQALMGDTPLMEPLTDTVSSLMSDIVEVMEYRTIPNGLGYSFRFYVQEMLGSEVKLLALDGVEPTVENIADGDYPCVTQLYAVTREGDESENTQALVDWLTSYEGQALVGKVGYVPNAEKAEAVTVEIPKAALRDGTLAVCVPDAWSLTREGSDTFASITETTYAVPEVIAETIDELLGADTAEAFREDCADGTARPVEGLRVTPVVSDNAFLMSARHMDGAWYCVLRVGDAPVTDTITFDIEHYTLSMYFGELIVRRTSVTQVDAVVGIADLGANGAAERLTSGEYAVSFFDVFGHTLAVFTGAEGGDASARGFRIGEVAITASSGFTGFANSKGREVLCAFISGEEAEALRSGQPLEKTS